MSNKAVIGGDVSVATQRAHDEQLRADDAVARLTMMQRRVNTFFHAVSEVHFPADAPAWATDWRECLKTGEVAKLVEAPAGEAPEAGPIGQDGIFGGDGLLLDSQELPADKSV